MEFTISTQIFCETNTNIAIARTQTFDIFREINLTFNLAYFFRAGFYESWIKLGLHSYIHDKMLGLASPKRPLPKEAPITDFLPEFSFDVHALSIKIAHNTHILV